MTFATLVNVISEEIRVTRHIPKIKRQTVHRLSVDLALVASSVRTAYLVDTFRPSNPMSFWEEFLERLRSNQSTETAGFTLLLHLYEPNSEQSFILNTAMLSQISRNLTETEPRCGPAWAKHKEYPVFVRPSNNDVIPPPVALIQTLSILRAQVAKDPVPRAHKLPCLPLSVSVPLAAILLDYGVAYVPADLDSAASSGTFSNTSVPVDFYDCILTYQCSADHSFGNHGVSSRGYKRENKDDNFTTTTSVTIMKFSCPNILANGHCNALERPRIIRHLEDMFTERLHSIGDPTLLQVSVSHTTHTLERLAF